MRIHGCLFLAFFSLVLLALLLVTLLLVALFLITFLLFALLLVTLFLLTLSLFLLLLRALFLLTLFLIALSLFLLLLLLLLALLLIALILVTLLLVAFLLGILRPRAVRRILVGLFSARLFLDRSIWPSLRLSLKPVLVSITLIWIGSSVVGQLHCIICVPGFRIVRSPPLIRDFV